MPFTENNYEKALIALFENMGYQYLYGPNMIIQVVETWHFIDMFTNPIHCIKGQATILNSHLWKSGNI